MIDGVHLIAEAIRAEQKAAAEAAGKTAQTVNTTKSEDDPLTAITGGKKGQPKKTDKKEDPAEGTPQDDKKEDPAYDTQQDDKKEE